MSEELFLHTAQVMKIDDEDKQGKVQIKILPEMEKVEDFPWAMPFVTHLSENTLENDLPEENSIIRVLVDKTWKRFYYLPNRYFYGLYDFSKISDTLEDADLDNVDTEYKNLHFRLFADGTLIFHNDSDGSHGLIQSTGSYTVFNADGSLLANIQKDIKVNQEGDTDYTQKGNTKFSQEGNVDCTIEKDITLTVKDMIDVAVDKAFSVTGKDKCNMVFDSSIALRVNGGALTEFGNQVATLGDILIELMTDLADLITMGPPTLHTSPKLTGEMTALMAKTRQVFK